MAGGVFEYVTHQKCLFHLVKESKPHLLMLCSDAGDVRVKARSWVFAHIYVPITMWPVTCEYILCLPLEHICYPVLLFEGETCIRVIYDRLTKAPVSFGLPTCVLLTHRAEGWGSIGPWSYRLSDRELV